MLTFESSAERIRGIKAGDVDAIRAWAEDEDVCHTVLARAALRGLLNEIQRLREELAVKKKINEGKSDGAKKPRRSQGDPRIEVVVVTHGGTKVEYKTKPGARCDKKQAMGAAALLLIGMGVDLPVEIRERHAKEC